MLTIGLNLYFISTVYAVEDLHSWDYFLITMQSVFDLIFSGVLILIRYLMKMWEMVLAFCYSGGFVRDYKHELDHKNVLLGQTGYLLLVGGFRNKDLPSVLLLFFRFFFSLIVLTKLKNKDLSLEFRIIQKQNCALIQCTV